ncbi:MAG: hypothetical protein RLZZ36_179 [Pseudomonadota bacterium]|jgi:hypothetical protein
MKPATAALDELLLGTQLAPRVPAADQRRQRREVDAILQRLERQPGVILADEVGMGKTFVALAVATTIALREPAGPVIVMAPSTLLPKWEQDLRTFCELYMRRRRPVEVNGATKAQLTAADALRYGSAKEGVALLRLLDDPRPTRAHLILVSHGAMSRQRMDKWVNLCMVAEALRRHARGGNHSLIQVKGVVHRYLAELLWMNGSERHHDLGEELWRRLLQSDPSHWKDIYNDGIPNDERKLSDDPVPKSVLRTVGKIELRELADALRNMPVRARGGEARVAERVAAVRAELRIVGRRLWGEVLAKSKWRSPLLVMDEAHHLKNAGTQLAKQLQSTGSDDDLRTGDGAMAGCFDRMLFLTATPFQLGHNELVHVLERFGDVRWDDYALGERSRFKDSLVSLHRALDESQSTSIILQKSWSRMLAGDLPTAEGALDEWWQALQRASPDALTHNQRALREAYGTAKARRHEASALLRPFVIRHNKGEYWAESSTFRRRRFEGAAIECGGACSGPGILVPPEQILPFFLAARAAVNPHKDLLGEALCSSYEAFRRTRDKQQHPEDRDETIAPDTAERARMQDELDAILNQRKYLAEFDTALARTTGAVHPKLAATVRRAVDLWQEGEKVVVFAFYRYTCMALRDHISDELKKRLMSMVTDRLGLPDDESGREAAKARLEQVQGKYFDDARSSAKQAMDAALEAIVDGHEALLRALADAIEVRSVLMAIMRRFLRVHTTLARCFPFDLDGSAAPAEVVARFLDHADASGMSWRGKFDGFIRFVLKDCTPDERRNYLEHLHRIRTGAHKSGGKDTVQDDPNAEEPSDGTTIANVAMCGGTTSMDARQRYMRTFNTPFFPDILVCSEVMSEGVDLQRFCRYMIHHDLAWNPSTIEQRTGRIDRIGCKAEGRHPINSFLPFIDGGADERQFRVMRDREQWFQVVMGQDAVANLITVETVDSSPPLPKALADSLAFDLSVGDGD